MSWLEWEARDRGFESMADMVKTFAVGTALLVPVFAVLWGLLWGIYAVL